MADRPSNNAAAAQGAKPTGQMRSETAGQATGSGPKRGAGPTDYDRSSRAPGWCRQKRLAAHKRTRAGVGKNSREPRAAWKDNVNNHDDNKRRGRMRTGMLRN